MYSRDKRMKNRSRKLSKYFMVRCIQSTNLTVHVSTVFFGFGLDNETATLCFCNSFTTFSSFW